MKLIVLILNQKQKKINQTFNIKLRYRISFLITFTRNPARFS